MCSVLGRGSSERGGLVPAHEALRVRWGRKETPRTMRTKPNSSPSAGKDRFEGIDEDTPIRASEELPWGAEGGTGVPGAQGQGTVSQVAGPACAKAAVGWSLLRWQPERRPERWRQAGGSRSPRQLLGRARGAERVRAGGWQLSRRCGNSCRHPRASVSSRSRCLEPGRG